MSWFWRSLSTRELYVLWCLSSGQVQRHELCGDLEPYLLDGRSVDGTLSRLALRGLVAFDLTRAARVTSRGRIALASASAHTHRERGSVTSALRRRSSRVAPATQPAGRRQRRLLHDLLAAVGHAA